MSSVTGNTGVSSDEDCYIDKKYYPHFFILPALVIMIILSLLKKRVSCRKTLWEGRPGLVVPMDFLGVDHDRIANIAAFGAATGAILQLAIFQTSLDDPWSSAFISIGLSLEVAVLYYPLFACLATSYKILGAVMGFIYCLMWFITATVSVFDKCNFTSEPNSAYMIAYCTQAPVIGCYLFLLGKYVYVIFRMLRERNSISKYTIFEQEVHLVNEFKCTKPWLLEYVRNVLKPRHDPEPQSWWRWLRKVYNPHPHFRFSTQSVSVYMVCFILIYMFSLSIFGQFVTIEFHSDNKDVLKLFRGFRISVIISSLLAGLFSLFSILRLMECHKNNMLRMFKGDKSFLPKLYATPQHMIGASLNYSCYQFGYVIWGYFLLGVLFTIIASFGFSLGYSSIRQGLGALFQYLLSFGIVALITWTILPVLALTVFRDRSFPKEVIALNNRNVYMVFTYFWFFVGLPMGFLSAMSRILKSMALGSVMLCRIDCSILPAGYEVLDSGHAAYLYYLHVQALFRNPILRVFCQQVYDSKRDTKVEIPRSKTFRNKWFLMVTLLNNPMLRMQRKYYLSQTATNAITNPITNPVSTYGSTNQVVDNLHEV